LLTTLALLAAVALAAVAALVAWVWWRQERIVFQPAGPPYPQVGDVARVTYRAEDGQELFAYVVGDGVAAERGALVAFHGNADLAAWRVPWARELARRTGWVVILPEYRGYSGLAGPPTADGVRHDARAAGALARTVAGERAGDNVSGGNAPLPIALHGHSLGSAVAAELAHELPETRSLLLESPFTSAREMARRMLAPAVLFWSAISRIPYDTRARVAALAVPVSVAHGEGDRIIPARMGRLVFEAARERGTLLLVRDAGHNDLVEVGGERYWEWVEKGLESRDSGPGTRD
jgi:fermentation-respiration switch protein FrsA (DUF1100 family)